MLRKAVPLALCLAVLLIAGCEKKEPDEGAPIRVVPSDFRPPPGMAPIPQMGGTFIDATPVTVGEYVQYLRESDQAVPEEYEGLEPDSPGAGQPVGGLSRQEARRMATWQLKRLPTGQEWDAAPMLRGEPYPWREDGSPASPDAEVRFVRDWKPDSEGESNARKAKARLRRRLSAMPEEQTAAAEPQVSPDELEELRAEVRETLDQKQTRFQEKWKEWKQAFFSMLEKKKKVAELEATAEAYQNVVEIVRNLATEKGRLAARLKTRELSEEQVEQEVAAYEDSIGRARTTAQQRRSELQKQTAAMQDEVMELTRELEQIGAEALPAVAAAEAALEEPPDQPAAERDGLQEALQQVQEAPDLPAQLPDLQSISSDLPQVETKIQRLREDLPESPPVEDLLDRMEGFGEAIGREFLQEKLLIDDLKELTELAASKKAVQARLKGLREALGREETAETAEQ